jgi:hypothetical protein
VFKSTLDKLLNCSCGPETSCYGCLRNYQNQYCHHILKRGLIAEFLNEYLSKGNKKEAKKEDENEFLIQIGKQGEENAMNYLKKIKTQEYKVDKDPQRFLIDTENGFSIEENGSTLLDVVWENAIAEKYKGYDISYKDEQQFKHYIEVKSTVSSTKKWFPITDNEWKYLLEKGNRYSIFRVFNVVVGEKFNDNIEIIKNPCEEWKKGKIKAFPYKIEI